MNARVFAYCGFGAGLLFLILGTLIHSFAFGGDVGFFSRLLRAQSTPLMWLVDTLPFVLGLAAGRIRLREDQYRSQEAAKGDGLITMAGELIAGAEALLAAVDSFSTATAQTATAVRETTSTMQGLSQSATQAALSAETVVGLVSKTKKYSDDGLQAIRISIAELQKLSEDVRGLSKSIEGVNDRMRNIFEIASVMNYLGERFQGLADSAAGELEQSAEVPLGLRFVVAEMRRQGKAAQNGASAVQNLVAQMQKAMTAAMVGAEVGVKRAERGALIATRTGDNIKKLGEALESSSCAAVNIALIAKEQDHDIDQVLGSMNNVFLAITEAMASTDRVASEAQALKELAGRLDGSARAVNASLRTAELPVAKSVLRLTSGRS